MKLAYFDCFSGAGGDMIVAALIHAGADARMIEDQFARLGIGGYRLSIEAIKKQGFAATRFKVALDEGGSQPHRHLKHIVEILERAPVSRSAREKAVRIFTRLAEAEAAVHGSSVEKVHFHEVGAVDAVLDVLGAVLALESLGIEKIVCSPVPVGSGTITCSHGVMPVPAPATAALLKGVPLAPCDETGELTTPTAAAILTTLADSYGTLPGMTIRAIGYGAGQRDGATRPNVLRVLIGETAGDIASGEVDEITILEANVDDASPEILGHCLERLLEEGALDAFAVPIHMKKSRTAVLLTVLCEPAKAAELEWTLFAETTTFGVRRHTATRAKLRRRFEMIQTRFGEIRMKIGERGGLVTASPEFESCKEAAMQNDATLREVMAEAHAIWAMVARKLNGD